VIEEAGIRNAVVFMDSVEHLPQRDDPLNDYYATGFMRNNLTFDGDVVYARNCRADNVLLARQFPERDYYLYRYNRRKNGAHLYRLTFDGAEQHLEPVTREGSRWLLPDRRPDSGNGADVGTSDARGMAVPAMLPSHGRDARATSTGREEGAQP
jgi:hypothetical protein